jgi:hypothetical protein
MRPKDEANLPKWSRQIEGFRRRLKLIQVEFARRLGAAPIVRSRWERGILEVPANIYIKLGNLAGDPLCWYFWGCAGLRSDLLAARDRLHESRLASVPVVHAGGKSGFVRFVSLGMDDHGLFVALLMVGGCQRSVGFATHRGADLDPFTVGTSPFFLATGGANIWVANLGSNNVTKLRACDGANLGTFAPGGHFPEGLAFDGGFMWVANTGNNTVAKM